MLRRGYHCDPARGGCLVEMAGTLPGGPWTDRSERLHPLLATVCRAVNDRLADTARGTVLIAVPWLAGTAMAGTAMAGTATAGTATARTATAGTATARTAAAGTTAADTPMAGRALGAALARLVASHAGMPAPARALRGRAARQAVRRLAARPDADERLRALLADAINLARTSAGLPVMPAGALDRPLTVTRLPVRVEAVRDTELFTVLHCRAELAGWPAELRAAWQAAQPPGRRCPVAG
ncbi:hypothetical protein Ade02nite_88590 [Paractinoplanes deccanensis]|uniref:Uncharacterized protein n=1 Tax=Paractinoplanes deccanensis TaxID=113561 RepID=A0ABQ3YJQ0_9ACTN|nr:hypothetical protein Ade02nite_88590 [Actinoplanes deccanensis]